MADLTHHAVEGEGGHNDDGQETALGGPMKKAHVENWAFSQSPVVLTGSGPRVYWEGAAGGPSWSKLPQCTN